MGYTVWSDRSSLHLWLMITPHTVAGTISTHILWAQDPKGHELTTAMASQWAQDHCSHGILVGMTPGAFGHLNTRRYKSLREHPVRAVRMVEGLDVWGS